MPGPNYGLPAAAPLGPPCALHSLQARHCPRMGWHCPKVYEVKSFCCLSTAPIAEALRGRHTAARVRQVCMGSRAC